MAELLQGEKQMAERALSDIRIAVAAGRSAELVNQRVIYSLLSLPSLLFTDYL